MRTGNPSDWAQFCSILLRMRQNPLSIPISLAVPYAHGSVIFKLSGICCHLGSVWLARLQAFAAVCTRFLLLGLLCNICLLCSDVSWQSVGLPSSSFKQPNCLNLKMGLRYTATCMCCVTTHKSEVLCVNFLSWNILNVTTNFLDSKLGDIFWTAIPTQARRSPVNYLFRTVLSVSGLLVPGCFQ